MKTDKSMQIPGRALGTAGAAFGQQETELAATPIAWPEVSCTVDLSFRDDLFYLDGCRTPAILNPNLQIKSAFSDMVEELIHGAIVLMYMRERCSLVDVHIQLCHSIRLVNSINGPAQQLLTPSYSTLRRRLESYDAVAVLSSRHGPAYAKHLSRRGKRCVSSHNAAAGSQAP